MSGWRKRQVAAQPEQKRPQNCGTGYCSCVECVMGPEQEPVGEIVDAIEGAFKCSFTKMLPVGAKLYATPSQRKPLSEEEIGAILEDVNAYGTRLYTFARAIEAAHGIKGKA